MLAATDGSAGHEEQQYLDLIEQVLKDGVFRPDRTGTGTRSVFGCQMRFSLANDSFPLLTTKRVFWRGVAEELLWFISGSTDAAVLSAKGINIWSEHGSKDYLRSIGLGEGRREGDLGPVYGWQWRHFGARYVDCDSDYSGQGIDQLAGIIARLKSNPSDRRLILSAWNPADLHLMALPPCHMFCQFYAANGQLSCQLYQRSGDIGLGVPFNIASYALLTRLVAHVVEMEPKELVYTLGDAHVYEDHVEALREQVKRQPRPFPRLKITPASGTLGIDDFEFEHFEVSGYDPHPKIAMKMSV